MGHRNFRPVRAIVMAAAMVVLASVLVDGPLSGTAGAAGGQVKNVTVSVSPEATGWPGKGGDPATYSISFVATDGINYQGSNTITIVGPSGTGFIWVFDPSLTDDTDPTHSVDQCGYNQGPVENVYYVNCGHIPAGDTVTITAFATNPPTPGTNDTLTVATTSDPTPVRSAPYAIRKEGYWLVGSDGGIFSFGSANFFGSMGATPLNRPVVGITPTSDRAGYWLDASDGGVFAFGDTHFYGSIPGVGLNPAGSGLPNSLNQPIVGMVPSVDDHGYFMVASDGGVFAFGDATFEGSCPGIGGCTGTAVAVMPDATGKGYWLVTDIGSIYAFGDVPGLGAPGNVGSPVVSAVRTPDGRGYWILDAAGDVHAYGDAADLGSATGLVNNNGSAAAAIFTDTVGDGFGVAAQNGAVATFGGVPNYGGMDGTNLNGSIIAASGY